MQDKVKNNWIVFGFQMQSSKEAQLTFEKRDVYRIHTVWSYDYQPNKADWAVLKLDREVEGREPFNTLLHPEHASLTTSLYMLGYPAGLPLKLTLSAEVQKTTHPHFFEADLDAFGDNSGSPVFNMQNGSMVGMLTQGNKDYTYSKEGIITPSSVSKATIQEYGYEKCHKITSIDFVSTLLSSSFKMIHSHFLGRKELLYKLKEHLLQEPFPHVHILYGPGGIGKSELATAFVNENIKGFSWIWSISCGTEEERRVGYQGLAQKLQIPLDGKESLDALMTKVHTKLEQNSSKPWLLLLDNLQQVLPLPLKGGSILITSYKKLDFSNNNNNAIQPKDVLATEVLPLSPQEALELLEKVTEKPTEDCKLLLKEFGYYPLILGQVASYLASTDISVQEYLKDL